MRGTSYSVIPATIEHIIAIGPYIREADRCEVYAGRLATVDDALIDGLIVSSECWVGLIDDEPACVFGVSPISIIGGIGSPWLLGTDTLALHALPFLRRNKRYLHRMLKIYPTLVNYVDARNTVAIAWLEWLGFTLGEAEPWGALQMPFKKLEMKAKDV